MKNQTCTIICPDTASFVNACFTCEGEEWFVELQFDNILVEGAGLTPQDAVDNAVASLTKWQAPRLEGTQNPS